MHEGTRFINLHRGLATRAGGGVGAAAASFALCRNLKSTPPRCWGSGGNLARLSRKLAHASRRETRSLVRDRGSKSTGHHCVFSSSCFSAGFLTRMGVFGDLVVRYPERHVVARSGPCHIYGWITNSRLIVIIRK